MKIEKKVTLHLDSEEVEKLKKILLFASLHFNHCIRKNTPSNSIMDAGICFVSVDHLRDFADGLNEKL